MNKTRRAVIREISRRIEEFSGVLEEIHNDEEECRDNIPENLWGSERYEKAESAVEALESALESLESVVYYLGEAME